MEIGMKDKEDDDGVAAVAEGEEGQECNLIGSDGLKRRRVEEEEDEMVPENVADLRIQDDELPKNQTEEDNPGDKSTENLQDFDGEKGKKRGRKTKVGRPKNQNEVGRKVGNQNGDLGGNDKANGGIVKGSDDLVGKSEGNGEVVRESGDMSEKGEGCVQENQRGSLDLDEQVDEIDSVKKTNGLVDDLGKEKLETDRMASVDQNIETEHEEEKKGSGVRRSRRQKPEKLKDEFPDAIEEYFQEDDQSKKRRKTGLNKKKRETEDDEENRKSRSRVSKKKKELDEEKDGSTSQDPDAVNADGKSAEGTQKRRNGRKTDENVTSVSRIYYAMHHYKIEFACIIKFGLCIKF